ncbi:alpha/beta hydrolase fold domain-containing protein [Streptomyces sp. PLAI1-29]|uniref:Alpha/beta hydrolase fold domain-containing protein n=1 Tax=Streptomyces zingiberis TaxID=2053010 RepID=A0ABX1BUG6_9ACTN|nr:alpha/beta hydrolase fold domain-containing protein [Streptomyces zingiberis]
MLALAPCPARRTVRYGPHPAQVIDYHLPEGAPEVRVTVLHGGFWREAYDRTHLSPFAAALARHGAAVALAEYRRVGGGGGWPATFADAARVAAVAWDDEGAGTTGGEHVLLGHSAGGHLALWAVAGRAPDADQASPPDRPPVPGPASGPAGRPGPDRVVAVAPVADLGRAAELGLSGGAVTELLGGPGAPEGRVRELLPLADPSSLPPPAVPVSVLHGAADPDVPVGLSRRYTAAMRRAGARVELRERPGGGHYAALTPGTAAFRELLDVVFGGPPGASAGRPGGVRG